MYVCACQAYIAQRMRHSAYFKCADITTRPPHQTRPDQPLESSRALELHTLRSSFQECLLCGGVTMICLGPHTPSLCLTPAPRPPTVPSLSLIFIERFLAPSRANCDNFSVCVIICYGLFMFSAVFSINSQDFHIFVDDLLIHFGQPIRLFVTHIELVMNHAGKDKKYVTNRNL